MSKKRGPLQIIHGDSCDYCEVEYEGSWIRFSYLNDKISDFTVIYSGKSIDGGTIIAQDIPLTDAIKMHSLNIGTVPPAFGYAVDRSGKTYGLADVPNKIVYDVVPVEATETVRKVSYLADDAPVFKWANRRLLHDQEATALLNAAKAALAVTSRPIITDIYKAPSREEAIQKLYEQNDIVMGKAARTLALIRDVMTWYEVDPEHPEAVSKSKQLREFLGSFHEEHGHLLAMYFANEGILRKEDILLLDEADSTKKEIESKMRRLKAMGFQ